MALALLAEGIETDDPRRQVLSCGCDRGQGFWFSPALPADEFFALATRFPASA